MHAAGQTAAAADETPEQRAISAILRDSDPRIPGAEHPLPLAASWSTGLTPLGFTPAWQVEQIRRGQYLLPWFWLAPPGRPSEGSRVLERLRRDLLRIRDQLSRPARLPLTFDMPPWEILLSRVSPAYAKKTNLSATRSISPPSARPAVV